jgi:myo-inositol-1(or 4)-monophosphatase
MLKERMDFMKRLALEAGRLTLEGYGKCEQVPKEGLDHYDIATEYDLRTEDLVKTRILKAFGEPVLGEEDGLIGDGEMANHKLWIVDPVDGTFNYQRGLPLYAVSIGYCEEGIPVCGAIYLPALDELFFAAQGSGAFLAKHDLASPVPLRISQEREWARLVISVAGGEAYRLVAACATAGIPWRSIRLYLCAVASLAYVAAGRLDIFVDATLSLWDCAAGDIILREAGGPATMDYHGVPVFPTYVKRRLELGDTSKFSVMAASSQELFQDPLKQLLSTAGLGIGKPPIPRD